MDFNCSHCSQPLSIADEEIAALHGRVTIACPSCGGKNAIPKPPSQIPGGRSPVRKPGQLKPPSSPAVVAASPPAAAPKKKRVKMPVDPAKMQRNLLILGCAALLMLGGIAGYLATREAGKTVHIEQKIINKLIENEYFQRLIRDGKTTADALAKIEDAYPYGKGFIGVSRAEHDGLKAQELARTTASEILDVTTSARQSRRELGDWIAATIPALKNHPVWVRDLSSMAVLDAPDLLRNASDRPRRVLLIWPASEPWPNKGWAWAVKPEFEAVEAFDAVTSLARAKSGGRWGLINLKGEWVLKPQYDRIGRFSSRLSAQITLKDASGQEKHGLVDHTGRVVAAPEWEEVQDLIHGFVPVLRGGKWGYLNADGKAIIPNEWEDAWRFSSSGFAVVTRDKMRGVVDRAGRLVVQPEWNGFINFTPDGIGAVRRGNDWGLMASSGNLLTPVEYDLDWRERTLDLGLMSLLTRDRKTAILGLDGKPLSSMANAKTINLIESPRGALLRVTWADETQSLQETGGKELFRTQGKGDIQPFNKEGLAFVEDARGRGWIDALGQLSAPLSHEEKRPPPPPYHGRSSQSSSQRSYGPEYGALPPNWTTRVVASRQATPYWNRYIIDPRDSGMPAPDLVAGDGTAVLVGMNTDHPALDDLIPYAVPPKYGLIDSTGKVLVEPTWDEARVLSRDWVLIRTGTRFGLADGAGKVIVQPDWDEIQVPYATYVSLAADGKTVQLGIEGERFRAPWILAYKAGMVTVLLPDGKPALPEKIQGLRAEYVDFYGPSRLVVKLLEPDMFDGVLVLFEPKTGAVVRFPDAATFRWNWNSAAHGVIWMKDAKATTELWRLMDTTGRQLGHTRLNRPDGWGFVEGRALHPTGDGWIVIDSAGQVIGGDQTWQDARDFREGLAAVKKDDKWGFIDLSGKLVIPPAWKEVHDFHHGRAAALGFESDFWGYLAPDGTLAMAALWTDAADFTEWTVSGQGESLSRMDGSLYFNRRTGWSQSGDPTWSGQTTDRTQKSGSPRVRPVALVHSGETWTLLDRDGFMIADPVVTPDSPSDYWLHEDTGGKVSLVRRKIEAVRGKTVTSVTWLDSTTAWVRGSKDDQWTLHDHKGMQIHPTNWSRPDNRVKPDSYAPNYITARQPDRRWALLSREGQMVLPARYQRIAWMAPGVAAVWADGEGGLVDTSGKWLFKDDARRRIARFGTSMSGEPPRETRYGLIVIEDPPQWGFARLTRP